MSCYDLDVIFDLAVVTLSFENLALAISRKMYKCRKLLLGRDIG